MSVHPCWRCECEKKKCDVCIIAKLNNDLYKLTGWVRVLLDVLPKCKCKERATACVHDLYVCDKCRFPVCEDVPWKSIAAQVEMLVKE